jgi:hypothetical protein
MRLAIQKKRFLTNNIQYEPIAVIMRCFGY